ncbi:MAG: type II toxin-antitoxin system Y4mF family antitoxin [Candidatus Omnitrophica bacterium]|nr:type II toxin-antitoxin system Y4mF family antitoxin [Candidatus Omnitrophota bacterium]
MVNISSQIKKLRKNNDLTQIEFAKRAGVGLRFLRELENGKMTVRMDKLMQILDFLGYHLELKRNEYQPTANNEKTDIN